VEDEESDFRITACVPNAEGCGLTVEMLSDEVVVETERGGKVEGCTRIHLPAPVNASGVTAVLKGDELRVVAPKAHCGAAAV
jgi:hypothetical protein